MNPIHEEHQLRLARLNRERQQKRTAKKAAKKAKKKAQKQINRQARPQPPKRRKGYRSPSIYKTEAWKRLRYEVLCEQKSTCQLCGASPRDGSVMNVDHIYPLNSHPHLALVKTNLRVLCQSCNWGKGGRSPELYEGEEPEPDEWAIPWDKFDRF